MIHNTSSYYGVLDIYVEYCMIWAKNHFERDMVRHSHSSSSRWWVLAGFPSESGIGDIPTYMVPHRNPLSMDTSTTMVLIIVCVPCMCHVYRLLLIILV